MSTAKPSKKKSATELNENKSPYFEKEVPDTAIKRRAFLQHLEELREQGSIKPIPYTLEKIKFDLDEIRYWMANLNWDNRGFKENEQEGIILDMLEGCWIEDTAECLKVCILPNGYVLLGDGQNRLAGSEKAIIKSNGRIKHVWMTVAHFVPYEALDVIDEGAKRRLVDRYKRWHVKFPESMSGAVRIFWQLDKGLMLRDQNRLYRREARSVIESHPGMLDSKDFLDEFKVPQGICTKNTAIALHYIFARKNRILANRFFKNLSVQENLNRSDSEWWLLRAITELRIQRPIEPNERIEMYSVAWNNLRNGTPKAIPVPEIRKGFSRTRIL